MDKEEILKITKDLPDIVAIAPNAFSRVVAAEYFPKYSIVCYKYRVETDLISADIPTFCIEKEYPEASISKMNSKEMLGIPVVREYINKKKNPHLLIYKPTPGLESVSYDTDWTLIGNSPLVKYDIENKLVFRSLLQNAGINAVIGESVLFDELSEDVYKNMVTKYGEKLVFQVAEMTMGGGTGTAFINSIDDFQAFMAKFTLKRQKLPSIEHVNITRFMEGIPTSIAGCVTKHGVITGSIQTQILDIGDVRDTAEGSGLFCGHDFGYGGYNEDLNFQAKDIAKRFGEYIYKNLNYKGIFGLDLITNVEEGKVYPIECNPRYTDAFPLISEIHNASGAIPMDVFHILEHMNVDYTVDVEEVSRSYQNNSRASQIILETKTNNWTKVTGNVSAGVYQIVPEDGDWKIKYDRPGYRYESLNNENEFLITEGVPFANTVFKGGSRILRLIFKDSILDNPKVLTSKAKAVIKCVYENLAITKSDPVAYIKNFVGLNVADIEETNQIDDAVKRGADVVNYIGQDFGFGFVRPSKIAWKMDVEGNDAFALIKAKRLKKHLKYWLMNLSKYGLTYEVKDEITSKEFVLWFEKYRELLGSKEYANIKINPSWIDYKRKTGKKVGAVFMYKNGAFLGGNILIYSDTGFTVGYGVLEKIKDPNWSIGAIVDFLSLKKGIDMGYKKIGFGQDNNLYGYHLSTGLLEYKLNFGLTPHFKETATIYTTKFINYNKFKDNIIFMGIKEGKNCFYILRKRGLGKDLFLNTNLDIIEADY